ncbi:DNA replication and repair protein RecF [Thermoleophilia bacterium SCSIO 60948]|nr:DNA replication and repair protein RecF [Thermoleophilia bacterium SCSIO 60948]
MSAAAAATRREARVAGLELRRFRNVARGEFTPADGITLLAGPNGAGKTNFLEALYMALTGRSPRTRADRETIEFGASDCRTDAIVDVAGEQHEFRCVVTRADGRAHRVDGRPAEPADSEQRPAICVFMPDRLTLIKGPPAARRSHVDLFSAALWPARADVRRRYSRVLAQRNALLARAAGHGASSLDAWDRELAEAGIALRDLRAEVVAELAPGFSVVAGELGLEQTAQIAYRPRSEATDAEGLAAELRERRDSDVARGYSGHGPHLDELSITLGDRAVRRYGSQGQQRLSLLALLFAEREVLAARRGRPPLMLLDDVTSELDPDRRGLLGERLSRSGQTLITSTSAGDLPPGVERTEFRVESGRITAGDAAGRPS